MATAMKQARTGKGAHRGAKDVVASESMPMVFHIDEDNGGDYHWTLLDREGTSLARSGAFASYERAEEAARVVRVGVGAAEMDPPASAH